jgi:hypothetical protein
MDKDPNRFHTEAWLRDRVKSVEKNVNPKHGEKCEMVRMSKTIKGFGLRSFEPLNTKSLYYPKCREEQKDKWMTKKPFVGMTGNMDKGWDKTPISDYDPYFKKFESIAEFSRKRDTMKEVGSNEWDAFSHSDSIWGKRVQTSNSLRTYKSITGYIQSINGG